MAPLKVFIGFDSREKLNYDICEYSIAKHASLAVDITPLKQKNLRKGKLYTRPTDEQAATEFSLTRFLTPYLSQYKGWSIFMDCDMIITRDIIEVLGHIDNQYAVKVVKHDYVPRATTKMDGQVQHTYPRKNWSSFILWNNEHPSNKVLTPKLINDPNTTPAYLHRFSWLKDQEIGALPIEYNFLVEDYDKPPNLPFNIHHTNGSPFFPAYANADYADVWYQYRDEQKSAKLSLMRYQPVSINTVMEKAIKANTPAKVAKEGCGC